MAPTSYKDGGAFSNFYGATPKYAQQGVPRTDGYKNTMARMYLYFPDKAASDKIDTYLKSVNDTRVNTLAAKVNLYQPPSSPPPPPAQKKGYIEFLLQSATHRYSEKVDVVETLADKYVAYAYGSSAPKFSYSVALLNNKQDDQAANMYRLYWHVLRATRLASVQAEVYFEYDRMIVAGVMTDFGWTLQAPDESYCSGSFDILVRKVMLLPEDSTKSIYDTTSGDPDTAVAIKPANFNTVVQATGNVLTITL